MTSEQLAMRFYAEKENLFLFRHAQSSLMYHSYVYPYPIYFLCIHVDLHCVSLRCKGNSLRRISSFLTKDSNALTWRWVIIFQPFYFHTHVATRTRIDRLKHDQCYLLEPYKEPINGWMSILGEKRLKCWYWSLTSRNRNKLIVLYIHQTCLTLVECDVGQKFVLYSVLFLLD